MRKWTMKYLTFLIATACMSTNALAVASGLYLGIMGGPATNSASNQQAQVEGSASTVTATPKSQQFGSRIYMGYMMNQYAGMEGGLTYFSGIRYDTQDTQTCSSVNSRVRDFEFMGKGVLPLRNFNIFGKAGVAVAYQTNSGAMNPTGTTTCGKSTYTNKFVPAFGIGAGYDMNQNWVVDFSVHDVLMGGKVSSMAMYALGISYHFVDVYCGQFLC